MLVGPASITAACSGDANYPTSTSPALSQVASLALGSSGDFYFSDSVSNVISKVMVATPGKQEPD
ncbi:MAG: hypothetical protein ABSD20_21100 [Terriglobales bacterium]|jgi:hypothetical protein